ncbi:FAD-dependent oxidoreductase [Micrococcus sp. 2A]|uniref:FAD-dependent oxidoreductase n=1 Tax=Micrococcus TaxID=1269 RepID=UPI00262CEE9C|nr:FAD-dependent oxidoreductase [uncultured Micrococcus sp.]
MRCVVVGAGIVGLATAVRLRDAGHEVTVIAPDLDAPAVGDAATHAAAGMLAPLGETQYSQSGLGALLARSWALTGDLVARIEAGGASAGHRVEGAWLVGAEPADARRWRETLAAVDAAGADQAPAAEPGTALRLPRPVAPVTVAALRRAEPALSPALAGALDAPDDDQLDPRRARAAALTRLAADDGVHLVPARAVTVHQVGEEVEVTTAGCAGTAQPITADVAVLAAGLGHAALGGDPAALPLPLRPVHGDILRLRVPASLLAPGEEHLLSRTVRALVGGRPVYLVPRAGGGLVLGATSREDREAGTPAGAVLDLLEDAARILPAIRDCLLEEVTTRARPGSPDDAPFLGPLPDAPRVIVCTGHHRHGVLLAAWSAHAALELVRRAAGEPGRPGGAGPAWTAADEGLLDLVRPDRFAVSAPSAESSPAPTQEVPA